MADITHMTLEGLARYGWEEVPLPFALTVDGSLLTVEQILRHLPGRRIAARARWRGETVFTKLFLQRKNDAAREKALLDRLCRHQIPAPAPLTQVPDDHGNILITQWCDADSAEHQPLTDLLPELVERVLQLADLGLCQRDLHTGNFLWDGSRLLIIDAAEISSVPASRRQHHLLGSLAMLCAQVPLGERDAARQYVEARLHERLGIPPRLTRRIAAIQRTRIRRMLRKWRRACSAIAVDKDDDGEWHIDRQLDPRTRARLRAAVAHPDQLPRIKQGSMITVYRCDNWIIKRYHYRDWRARLKRRLFRGRADISWVMGWALAHLGVPTPKPVLLQRRRDGSGTIVCPRIDGSSLAELIARPDNTATGAATRARFWLDALHAEGFWHGDTKASNALVDDHEEVWWIDLDAAGYSRWPALRDHNARRDDRRFQRNWP